MSIRLRLTFFYSAILACTLAVLGGALYAALNLWLASQLDDLLAKQAQEVLDTSPAWVDRTGRLNIRLPVDAFASRDMFVQVVETSGQVRARSENLETASLPVSIEMLELAAQRSFSYEDVQWRGELLRLYSTPFIIPGDNRVVLVVQVGTLLTDQYRALALLQKLLLVGGGVSVLAAFGLGWLMAGAALRPIARISQTAEEIGGSGDFTRRVQHLGPCDEVGRLAMTINAMLERVQAATERLEDALRQQRRFVADASHELRTPLTSIRSNVGLLRRVSNINPEDRDAALADIDDEAARMSRLVTDLLTLARADAGRRRRHEPTPLRPLVLDVCRQANVLAEQIDLQVAETEEATVSGDGDALRQLLLILLDNAIKYTPAGGQVRLSLQVVQPASGQDEARISVRDTGIGIPAAALPHIFDRFYRVDTARSGGGSGLGLAIARSIVQEHGGRLEVQSTPGTGSCFTVALPLLEAPAATPDAPTLECAPTPERRPATEPAFSARALFSYWNRER